MLLPMNKKFNLVHVFCACFSQIRSSGIEIDPKWIGLLELGLRTGEGITRLKGLVFALLHFSSIPRRPLFKT